MSPFLNVIRNTLCYAYDIKKPRDNIRDSEIKIIKLVNGLLYLGLESIIEAVSISYNHNKTYKSNKISKLLT